MCSIEWDEYHHFLDDTSVILAEGTALLISIAFSWKFRTFFYFLFPNFFCE
jgi:hypothetical protein